MMLSFLLTMIGLTLLVTFVGLRLVWVLWYVQDLECELKALKAKVEGNGEPQVYCRNT